MSEVTDNLDVIVRYCPLFFALLFWVHHFVLHHRLHAYEEKKLCKNWYDLPRQSATEDKEVTLKKIIEAESQRVTSSRKMAVFVSAVALSWLFFGSQVFT